jgi:hypothetical protein
MWEPFAAGCRVDGAGLDIHVYSSRLLKVPILFRAFGCDRMQIRNGRSVGEKWQWILRLRKG